LRAHVLAEHVLDFVERRRVGELGDPDRLDVRRQERPVPGQGVAASGAAAGADRQEPEEEPTSIHHATTTLTSLPCATMTFLTVFPAKWAATAASAIAFSRISASLASTGTVILPRSFPFTCTGPSIHPARAAPASTLGPVAAARPLS